MNEQHYQDLVKFLDITIKTVRSKVEHTTENDDGVRPEDSEVVSYIREDLNIDWDDSTDDVPTSYFFKIWGPDFTGKDYEDIIKSENYLKLQESFKDLWEAVFDYCLSINIEAAIDYRDEQETQSFLNHWIVYG